MRRSQVALLAAIALLGPACSNDACNQLATAFQTLQSNTQNCPQDAPTGSFDTAACEQEISSCDSSDQQAIERAAQCADNLPACTVATESQFEGGEVACVLGLSSLSPSCANIAAPFLGTAPGN